MGVEQKRMERKRYVVEMRTLERRNSKSMSLVGKNGRIYYDDVVTTRFEHVGRKKEDGRDECQRNEFCDVDK